jgi:hypothetical protein
VSGKIEDHKPRTCLTCRHLKIGEEGRMVEGMPETDFQVFRCALLDQRTEEYFEAPTPKSEFEKPSTECPFWAEIPPS